ncbi:MAG: hypothetical protein RL348_468 [Bacteroidota bacterium]|jgi:hypothetical protein
MSCLWDAQGSLKCQDGKKQMYIENFTQLPPGSYKQSCIECTTSSTKYWLNNCRCKNIEGKYVQAQTYFRAGDCKGRDISNNNGKLQC